MIRNLYLFGKALEGLPDDYSEYFYPWQNAFPRLAGLKYEPKTIVADVENGQLVGLSIEIFRPTFADKYLYRPVKGANGTNLVPTFNFFLSKEKVEKEERAEIEDGLRCFFPGREDFTDEEIAIVLCIKKLMKKIRASFKNNGHNFLDESGLNELERQLNVVSANFKFGEKHLFTMRLGGKWFGDYSEYIRLFENDAYLKYYEGSSSKNKTCSVTYQESPEVWGRVDTLGFTVNDEAFSRNGFNKKDSYKMFPVSPEAVRVLEASKRFVFEKLSKNFYGMKYFVLPHFIGGFDEGLRGEIVGHFINKVSAENPQDGMAQARSIMNNENFFQEIADDEKLNGQGMYYDMFVYEPSNAQLMIKLHLSDIAPSRFGKIIKAKGLAEHFYGPMNDIRTKTGEVNRYHIAFGAIKDFFSKTSKASGTTFHPYFFKIMEKVFCGGKINTKTLLDAFLADIRANFKDHEDEYAFPQSVKRSFTLYHFFAKLDLLDFTSTLDFMEENTSVPMDIDGFVEAHAHFFAGDAYKIGVFKLGCLTQRLLAKQDGKLKNSPFYKNLNGLSLDEKNIQKLFPKLIDKLRQYEASNVKLEGEVAGALMSPCRLSKADISYSFTLGMIMQKEFNSAYFREEDAKKEAIKNSQKTLPY